MYWGSEQWLGLFHKCDIQVAKTVYKVLFLLRTGHFMALPQRWTEAWIEIDRQFYYIILSSYINIHL